MGTQEMSTTDETNQTITEPMNQRTHLESEIRVVAELVYWRSIPVLSAREIAQRKLVSKSFAAWVHANIITIAKARRENDTRDWYFPILARNFRKLRLLKPLSWSWSGIWHATADQSSAKVHTLPPLAHHWIHISHPRHDIIACAGGLLLIKFQTRESVSDWQSLLVCNPLTNESRGLPDAKCEDLGLPFWDYQSVQVLMLVDDTLNLYKVILTFTYCVCVYNSMSNTWACKLFPESGPWGNQTLEVPAWGYVCASASSGGRLFFADVQLSGPIVPFPFAMQAQGSIDVGFLRIFKIEEEAGTWKLYQSYPLKKWYLHFLHLMGTRTHRFRANLNAMSFHTGILRYLNLVECMGDFYAIIPARLDEVVQGQQGLCDGRSFWQKLGHGHIHNGVEFMPLMFHILKLRKEALMSHGLLRIEIPQTRSDIQSRREALFMLTWEDHQPFRNWFSCTAVGSVLWVSCEDYLLKYDVVSRESRTQIITMDWSEDNLGFAYRPSFHMKP